MKEAFSLIGVDLTLPQVLKRLNPFIVPAMLAAGTAVAEQGWPQFRGPRGDGTSMARDVPVSWSETNNLAWKVPIPGRGHSSPIVLEGSIWLTTAIERGVKAASMYGEDMRTAEHVTLEALRLDGAQGNVIWRTPAFEVDNPAPVHAYNSWATPTPVVEPGHAGRMPALPGGWAAPARVVEPGRLYCDFGAFGTACLDAKTGRVLWKASLPVEHQFGPGSSPVLWGNLLLLVRDGNDAQYVSALDKQTGQTAWKSDRPPMDAESAMARKSFITPLVITNGHRIQLLCPAAHWVVSYDPLTGKELWRARHGEGYSGGSSPVFGHGLAMFSTGNDKAQLVAVRVDGQGDVTASQIAWRTLRQVPVMSSPVLAGDEIYWVSDQGMASCGDARTGEIHWQERLGGLHFASPLYAEGRVYFFAQDGRTTVAKAGQRFEKLAENRIEGPLAATPAMVDGTVFVRTDRSLYRIGRKPGFP